MNAVDKCRECAAKGMTQKETADTIGVCKSYVCKIAKKHGITFARRVAVTAETERQILKMARLGVRQADIAKKVGLVQGTISRICIGHGIRRYLRGGGSAA